MKKYGFVILRFIELVENFSDAESDDFARMILPGTAKIYLPANIPRQVVLCLRLPLPALDIQLHVNAVPCAIRSRELMRTIVFESQRFIASLCFGVVLENTQVDPGRSKIIFHI